MTDLDKIQELALDLDNNPKNFVHFKSMVTGPAMAHITTLGLCLYLSLEPRLGMAQ